MAKTTGEHRWDSMKKHTPMRETCADRNPEKIVSVSHIFHAAFKTIRNFNSGFILINTLQEELC